MLGQPRQGRTFGPLVPGEAEWPRVYHHEQSHTGLLGLSAIRDITDGQWNKKPQRNHPQGENEWRTRFSTC